LTQDHLSGHLDAARRKAKNSKRTQKELKKNSVKELKKNSKRTPKELKKNSTVEEL